MLYKCALYSTVITQNGAHKLSKSYCIQNNIAEHNWSTPYLVLPALGASLCIFKNYANQVHTTTAPLKILVNHCSQVNIISVALFQIFQQSLPLNQVLH